MFKKLLMLLVMLGFLNPNLAKSTEETKGEEELFKKQQEQKEESAPQKRFEITLGFEFDWIQAYGYSEKLFRIEDKAYEGRFPLTVAYLFSENSKIYIVVPYVLKYAFVGYQYMGLSEEWEFAMGLGDIRGGICYQIMNERRLPLNLLISADVISNTGRVHYGSLSDRCFGNGYWNIASAVEISKTVHARATLFGSTGYVYRFKKSDEWIFIYEDDVFKGKVEYKPRNISFYNSGIASAVGKKSWLGLEFRYTSGIQMEDSYAAESRLGISYKEVKNGVLTDVGFLGKGWLRSSEKYSDYWLIIWTVPFRLKIFGVSL
jgi:hypothetical protein